MVVSNGASQQEEPDWKPDWALSIFMCTFPSPPHASMSFLLALRLLPAVQKVFIGYVVTLTSSWCCVWLSECDPATDWQTVQNTPCIQAQVVAVGVSHPLKLTVHQGTNC